MHSDNLNNFGHWVAGIIQPLLACLVFPHFPSLNPITGSDGSFISLHIHTSHTPFESNPRRSHHVESCGVTTQSSFLAWIREHAMTTGEEDNQRQMWDNSTSEEALKHSGMRQEGHRIFPARFRIVVSTVFLPTSATATPQRGIIHRFCTIGDSSTSSGDERNVDLKWGEALAASLWEDVAPTTDEATHRARAVLSFMEDPEWRARATEAYRASDPPPARGVELFKKIEVLVHRGLESRGLTAKDVRACALYACITGDIKTRPYL
ncbi:hypothetical protein RQP46_008580 [Phenoliferia psychrophenolica]